MQELNMHHIAQVNGGLPLVVAIPVGYALRKYGARAAWGAIGAATAWYLE